MLRPAISAAKPGPRPRPWDPDYVAPGTLDLRIASPRSPIPSAGRWMLVLVIVAGLLLSLRFALLGAWPVMVFALLDVGALALALAVFVRTRPAEERLRIGEGRVLLTGVDRRGRTTRLELPSWWTRLEIEDRSETDCRLWLVHRGTRHPVGLCVGVAERRALAPRIAAALTQTGP
ncbi:MAG TPA: DUF2244 domain-containing protein [Allosphingosinicella sp.]|nr:DUF2244 domain-containing protein [Allosphingosinicella sp.]